MIKKFIGSLLFTTLLFSTFSYADNDDNKKTPEEKLYAAIKAKDYRESLFWMKQRTDLNALEQGQRSYFPPLWVAAQENFPDVMEDLVLLGAEVNLGVNGEETPLKVAMNMTRNTTTPEDTYTMTRELLYLGADPNLYGAVAHCFEAIALGKIKTTKILELLLEYGLDPYSTDSYDRNAFDYLKKTTERLNNGTYRNDSALPVLEEALNILENATKKGPYAMVRDLEKHLENEEDINDVISNNPELYNDSNVEKLIKFGARRADLAQARDILTKASLITYNMKNKKELGAVLREAQREIKERPLKTLINRIRLSLHNVTESKRATLSYALLIIDEELNGKLGTISLAKIAFGSRLLGSEDSLFFQAGLMLAKEPWFKKQVNKARIKILGNNYALYYSGTYLDRVEYEKTAEQLGFMEFLLGINNLKGISLPEITEDLFSDPSLSVTEQMTNKGLEKFKIMKGIVAKKR